MTQAKIYFLLLLNLQLASCGNSSSMLNVFDFAETMHVKTKIQVKFIENRSDATITLAEEPLTIAVSMLVDEVETPLEIRLADQDTSSAQTSVNNKEAISADILLPMNINPKTVLLRYSLQFKSQDGLSVDSLQTKSLDAYILGADAIGGDQVVTISLASDLTAKILVAAGLSLKASIKDGTYQAMANKIAEYQTTLQGEVVTDELKAQEYASAMIIDIMRDATVDTDLAASIQSTTQTPLYFSDIAQYIIQSSKSIKFFHIPEETTVFGNACLSTLTASIGTLTPALSKETFEYTLSVPADTFELTLTPTIERNRQNVVYIDGSLVISGQESSSIYTFETTTKVEIKVPQANGKNLFYTINIRKNA